MSIQQFSVEDKKVLCVGAGRGIGRWIANSFAEAGADVAVTGLTSSGAGRVAEEVRKLGRRGLAFAGDATKGSQMDQLAVEVLQQFGNLDVLVNCVGDAINRPVAPYPEGGPPGMTEEEWHNIIDINLTAAFQGCRAFGPHSLAKARLRYQPLRLCVRPRCSQPLRLLRGQGGANTLHRVRGPRMGRLRGAGQRHRPGHVPRLRSDVP